MGWRTRVSVGGLLGLMLGTAPGAAQTIAASKDAIQPGSGDALHAMSRIAAVIFAGRVMAVRRHEAVGGATGVVEIEFAVDDAIRGAGGGTYILREWGGLWGAGYEPFHVGERYLMLLHAPGAAGLSSPVGGSDGSIPIRGGDGARAAASVKVAAAGISEALDGGQVDLRWVATRATRAVAYGAETVARPTLLPVAVRAYAAAGQVDVPEPSTNDAASADGAACTTVVAMLRSWEKGDDVAR